MIAPFYMAPVQIPLCGVRPKRYLQVLLVGLCVTASSFAQGKNDSAGVAAADSLKRPGIIQAVGGTKPNVLADSLARAHRRDSLENEISLRKKRYLSYPASLDSIFNLSVIRPYQVMKSDAIGPSDLLRLSPQIVSVPFSLSNELNRFMLYGFPLLPNEMILDNSMFPENPTSMRGSDAVFSQQCYELVPDAPAGVSYTQRAAGLISPDADLLWENGVFLENILGVRFERPLSKTMDIGVYSNNRFFAPRNYTTANDIQTLYQYYFSDTSLISMGGRNPLSSEHMAEIRLDAHAQSGPAVSLSYTYEGCTNEQAMQFDTADTSCLLWKKVSRYASIASLRMQSLKTPVLSSSVEAKVFIEGHTVDTPLTLQNLTYNSQSGDNSEFLLDGKAVFQSSPTRFCFF